MDRFKNYDTVTFGHPDEGDYQMFFQFLGEHNLTNYHFIINEQINKPIHLLRGRRYFFTFRPIKNDNLFTFVSKVDSKPLFEGSPPLSNTFRTVTFQITDDFPEIFYYQCCSNFFTGGAVIVHPCKTIQNELQETYHQFTFSPIWVHSETGLFQDKNERFLSSAFLPILREKQDLFLEKTCLPIKDDPTEYYQLEQELREIGLMEHFTHSRHPRDLYRILGTYLGVLINTRKI